MAGEGGERASAGEPARRWRFASAELDEAQRRLTVDGAPVALEAKPMAVLGTLLHRAGEIVTKDELLDAVWPGVTVVEASLPTAILKLRRALNDEKGEGRVVETIPRVGYRLAVPVTFEDCAPVTSGRTAHGAPARRRLAANGLAFAVVLGLGSLVVAKLLFSTPAAPTVAERPAYSEGDVRTALRKLDVGRVEHLIRLGWDPNTTYGRDGCDGMCLLLQNCEWDVGHDRERMVLIARTLLEAGDRLDYHNHWGDTAYSIAKAPRYCGPDHPVTKMLKALCYNGYKPLGDKCLATYELKRRKQPAKP